LNDEIFSDYTLKDWTAYEGKRKSFQILSRNFSTKHVESRGYLSFFPFPLFSHPRLVLVICIEVTSTTTQKIWTEDSLVSDRLEACLEIPEEYQQ